MMIKLFVLSWLVVLISGDATPDIELAGFDDLFKLATGNDASHHEGMLERADRSLTNTYPFNTSPNQRSRNSRQRQRNSSPGASVLAARASYVQNYLGSPQPKTSGVNNENGLSSVGAPASSFHLEPQSPNAGFTLLAGFGSRANPRGQYNIGNQQPVQDQVQAQVQAQVRAQVQAQVQNQLQGQALLPIQTYNPPQSLVPARTPASPFSNFPVAAPVPAYAYQDVPQDIASPIINVANDLFGFTTASPTRRPTRKLTRRPTRPPATRFVNPNRRRNPAQRRRKPAGQTFDDVAAAGQRCIDKIEQVEEIEYDEVEECDHSYDKKCHTSYSTEFESQQEEECDDNYKKDCAITYSPQANNVTVRVCMTPLVKDCSIPGPEVCRTEYISECWTKNDPHIVQDDVPKCRTEYEEKCVEKQSGYVTEQECSKWPKEVCTVSRELKTKFNPVTACEKVPQELCGPAGCGFVPGAEECHDAVKTVVTDVPSEICDLQPQRNCAHVTKLVPKLTPVEECVDVPKEVCQRKKGNPRTVFKPVTKTWCYTPTEESGLA